MSCLGFNKVNQKVLFINSFIIETTFQQTNIDFGRENQIWSNICVQLDINDNMEMFSSEIVDQY